MRAIKLSLKVFVMFALAGQFGIPVLNAQQPGVKRVVLQRADLSIAGREVVVVRAAFDADGFIGRHTHPGEESSYLLEGRMQLEIDGKAPLILNAGDAFMIPAGVVHAAKNIGKTPATVLATYIVEKGKPLVTPAK